MEQPQNKFDLEDFITNRMRMNQVYQPAMIKVLLENGGHASVEQIARALLNLDRSQLDYFSIRTKTMVGQVLTKNGVVTPIKDGTKITGYRLNQETLTEAERASLSAICDAKLDDFTNSRGDAIWSHRGAGREYLPGSIRYQVLKRAKYRCELCGALEGQAALQVDHIIPKARGGADDLINFQALCSTCNANKRDTDDTDFRGVAETYHDREAGCIFCELDEARIVAENELCIAIEDGFPVTQHHTLIIPKRHVADYFDLYQPERNAIEAMLHNQRQKILGQDPTVTGFNVGINAGRSAGQTVLHVHVHLIPRRDSDVTDPKGGVRGVIPSKQKY